MGFNFFFANYAGHRSGRVLHRFSELTGRKSESAILYLISSLENGVEIVLM